MSFNRLHILVLSLSLVPLLSGAAESKPKRVYYNPYYLLAGRTALNALGATICGIALEKCATESTRLAVDLAHIASAVFWTCKQSCAAQKFESEKRTWNTIIGLNAAIQKYNKNFSKITT